MTVPAEYSQAADRFYEYLVDARDEAGLGSTHQAYTMTQGVLQVFRRRLPLADALRFAGTLPVGLRALFVADWDTAEPVRPFEDRTAMTLEARALRAEHNFAPDSAIHDVAAALRRHVDVEAFERVLDALPEGAGAFWRV